MSTVAKLLVISGLVVLAFSASGGMIFGYFLIGLGLVFPREKPQDSSAERVEALEQYVRRLHAWIVEREASHAATATAPIAGTNDPRPAEQKSPVTLSLHETTEVDEPVAEAVPSSDAEGLSDATDSGDEPVPFPQPVSAPSAEQPEAAAAFGSVPPVDTHESRPAFAAARAAVPQAPAPRRSLFDFEQILGTNWLAKVGVAILVIGVSFFLAWQLRELGPAGKVTVGTVVGLAMLGAGIWFERNERYRILARAGLAGGWALLFFVSWAAHHLTATRVVDSPTMTLVLMLLVGAAMVVHTLRYRSQVVTGLAFILAFSTVALNRADVVGLTANVVLAIGFSIVVVRMRWFQLEIAGIIAAYLNHYLWLRPLIVPEQASVDLAGASSVSLTILLLYWVIFRASFVMRRAPDEKSSVIAGLLNSGLLLAVLKVHPAPPETAFWLLLALGSVELALSRLPIIRSRRDSFIALTTLGTMFVTAAMPLRFAPASVTVGWLVNAIVLSAVGILTRERVYRRLGTIIAAATAMQLIAFPLAEVFRSRSSDVTVTSQLPLAFITLAVAAWLLAEATILVQRYAELYPHPLERNVVRALGYVGVLLILPAGWLYFPHNGAAVFWATAAIVLAALNHRIESNDLAIHATILGTAAVLRALTTNLEAEGPMLESGSRAITIAAIAVLLYALGRLYRSRAEVVGRKLGYVLGLWGGTGLLAILAAHEVRELQLALAWTIFGFLLGWIGRRFASRHLLIQSNVLATVAAIQVLVVNLPSNAIAFDEPWPVSWRIPATLFAVALLYALARWNRDLAVDGSSSLTDTWQRLGPSAPQWGGTALLVLLAWYEFVPAAVAVAWTLIAMFLLEVGLRRDSRSLVLQANALFLLTFIRVFVVNMNIDDFGAIGARVFTVVPIAVALVYAYWRSDEANRQRVLAPRWFAPLHAWLGIACVAALLRFQLAADAVVTGWAALTFLLMAFAAFSRRRVFAHIAVAVTLMTLARAGLHNLYERSYFPSPGAMDRWMWVGGAAALLFGSLAFAFRLRIDAPPAGSGSMRRMFGWLDARPEQLLFFVPLAIVTALIGVEMRSGMLTVAWGLEGVLVFVFALLVSERSYRLSGLALLLLCVGKIFALDFWALGLRDKALTGIVIGLALIGVSILYSRKRETILKYL